MYPSGTVLSDYSVELYSLAAGQPAVSNTKVTGEGEFFFKGLSAASPYVVRVKQASGDVIGEQMVAPSEGLSRVQVRLPGKKRPEGISDVISITELSHKVPAAALKEGREADKALKKGDYRALIFHLEKVIAIDPRYIRARRNLSLAYLKTAQFDQAINAFQKLAEVDPQSALPYAGISAAYYSMHRFPDCEMAARRSLEVDGSYELGHFMLGTVLAAENKDHQMALDHLAHAFKGFPEGYVTAAGILARQGQWDEAKQKIQAYFDSGETTSRTEAEQLLKLLY